MTGFLRRYRSFRKREHGNATIEFVFLFPVFMFLFLTGFEAGYYMVRNVLLERAVDVTVRDVRLGNGNVPDFDAMKVRICEQAAIIPDCLNAVQIEMRSVAIAPGGTTPLRAPARCVDRESTDDPLTGTTFDVGAENEMMMVRVCALTQPLFPSTGIGVGMQVDNQGNYAIVATSGFVNEPGNRATSSSP
ncbi:MAG: TadE/TadG family type IV pilus assembly protein [Pseudomonadota bacterium]